MANCERIYEKLSNCTNQNFFCEFPTADRPQTWRTGTKAGTQYMTDWPITIVYSHTAEYWHNTSITLSIYVIETVTYLSERLNAHKGITDYNKLTYCHLFIIVTNYIAFHDFQSCLSHVLFTHILSIASCKDRTFHWLKLSMVQTMNYQFYHW